MLAQVSAAAAADDGRPTPFIIRPLYEAQFVRGSDGMDHIERDLLLVSMLPGTVTLSRVTVLDPAG